MDVVPGMRSGRNLWLPGLVLVLVVTGAWIIPLWGKLVVPLQVLLGVAGVAAIAAQVGNVGAAAAGLGIRVDNLLSATLIFAVATVALCTPAFLSGDVDRLRPFPLSELPSYFLWALFQQLVAVGGLWLPFRKAAGVPLRYTSLPRELPLAVATGLVFAAAHAPNIGLMVLVGVAEVIWLSLFARWRNLLSLALAHAAAALVVAHHLAPSPWLPSMRVGLAYFRS